MSLANPQTSQLGQSPIAQLCFVTDDLEASVAAFASLMGLSPGPFSIAANDATPTTYMGKATIVRARTCAFQLANIDVEFLEPGPEPSIWRDSLDAHGVSLHHIAFRCEDLDDAQTALAGQALSPKQSANFVNGEGRYAAFDTAKTIGATLELFEVRPQPKT